MRPPSWFVQFANKTHIPMDAGSPALPSGRKAWGPTVLLLATERFETTDLAMAKKGVKGVMRWEGIVAGGGNEFEEKTE
jgi:hypothetical protein